MEADLAEVPSKEEEGVVLKRFCRKNLQRKLIEIRNKNKLHQYLIFSLIKKESENYMGIIINRVRKSSSII